MHLLSIISDERNGVRALVRNKGYTFPVLYDRRGDMNRAYRVTSLPWTVIIDSQGKIVHDFSGTADIDILMSHVNELTSQ